MSIKLIVTLVNWQNFTFGLSNNDAISQAPFNLVHSDIWGLSPLLWKLFIILLHLWMNFFNIHGFIFSKFAINYLKFIILVRTQYFDQIKIFILENTLEHKEKSFLTFLAENGTISQ